MPVGTIALYLRLNFRDNEQILCEYELIKDESM